MEALAGRESVVGELARLVVRRARDARDHVFRVAVTGITACGKSTLATELTARIRSSGEPCVRLAVDEGFHQPKAIRYRRGRESAEGYYRDAYNYDLLISRVLRPLGPGGDLSYSSRAFDLERDALVEPVFERANPGSVAILDASFLLREEVREWFDYRILVHTTFDNALRRGVNRDRDALGGDAEAERLYQQRYHAAQRIYFREARPFEHADAVFVNDDLGAPVLFTRVEIPAV